MAKRYGRPVRRALCPLLVLLAFLSGLLLLPGQALASDRSYQITQVDIDATVDADGTAKPVTLQALAHELGVSAERVRQIEKLAIKKMGEKLAGQDPF